MSAFMCSDKHINALVSFAIFQRLQYLYGNQYPDFAGREQECALILQAANAASVNYRYAHNPDAQCDDDPIKFRYAKPLPPVTIIKLCDCFDYQSCEVKTWETSEAHAMLHAIKERAIRELPGYKEAPWSI